MHESPSAVTRSWRTSVVQRLAAQSTILSLTLHCRDSARMSSMRSAFESVIGFTWGDEYVPLGAGMTTPASRTLRVRESAAQRLLQPEAAGAPAYAKELARLELARSCSDKRSALRALLDLHDTRALPALRRLSSEPPSGCGPRKDQDCLGCLRRDLRAGVGSNG